MKKILFFAILFLLVNVSAMKVSITPSHISLIGRVDQNVCHNITLSSDKEVLLYGEDKWSLGYVGGELGKYNFEGEELDMEVTYSKELIINDKEEISFCVKAHKSGKYYGTVFYKSENGFVGIGNLIELDVYDEKNYPLMFFSLSLLLLLCVLLFLTKIKFDQNQ